MTEQFSRLGLAERAAIALSLLLAAFLLLDPMVLGAVRGLDQETRAFFGSFTDLGKSAWILILLGLGIIAATVGYRRELRWRWRPGWGHFLQLFVFAFAAVAGASLAASLTKNILGRARPKFFDQVGPVEFEPFSFSYGYATFPSAHAATICALAATLAILFPRARVYLFVAAAWIASTRFLIGSHYLTDVLCGGALGFVFPYLLRDRLAARRWLFRRGRDGGIGLRGGRMRGWLGAQAQARFLPYAAAWRERGEARFSGHS